MLRLSKPFARPVQILLLSAVFSIQSCLPVTRGCEEASAQETAPIELNVVGKQYRRKNRRKKTADQVQPSNARLYGTLWVQGSLEYAMSAMQVYQAAEQILPTLISDSSQFALLEQKKTNVRMMAVIMDVDETVLNNSPYQARLVETGSEYTSESWEQWVNEATAEAVPGAAEFIHFARRKSVQVFFVTNRTANMEEATVLNLSAVLGYQVDPENVLMKGEEPEWTSDKSTRRQMVAKDHRVVMLFGDDFNDFVSLAKLDPANRQRIGLQYSRRFGRQWMLLPNPLYGSWERSLHIESDGATFEQKLKLKRGSLKLR